MNINKIFSTNVLSMFLTRLVFTAAPVLEALFALKISTAAVAAIGVIALLMTFLHAVLSWVAYSHFSHAASVRTVAGDVQFGKAVGAVIAIETALGMILGLGILFGLSAISPILDGPTYQDVQRYILLFSPILLASGFIRSYVEILYILKLSSVRLIGAIIFISSITILNLFFQLFPLWSTDYTIEHLAVSAVISRLLSLIYEISAVHSKITIIFPQSFSGIFTDSNLKAATRKGVISSAEPVSVTAFQLIIAGAMVSIGSDEGAARTLTTIIGAAVGAWSWSIGTVLRNEVAGRRTSTDLYADRSILYSSWLYQLSPIMATFVLIAIFLKPTSQYLGEFLPYSNILIIGIMIIAPGEIARSLNISFANYWIANGSATMPAIAGIAVTWALWVTSSIMISTGLIVLDFVLLFTLLTIDQVARMVLNFVILGNRIKVRHDSSSKDIVARPSTGDSRGV